MAYFEGEVSSAFALLDFIKGKCIAQGWSVLRDTKTLYTSLPTNLEGVTCSVTASTVTPWFDGSMNTNGSATYFVLTIPQQLKPVGYYIKGSGSFSLKCEGVDENNVITELFTTTAFTDNTALANTKVFKQYRFTISTPANIKEFNLVFDTTQPALQELILHSTGFSGESNIFIGYKAQLQAENAVSIGVSTFAGYAQANTFETQPNYIAAYTYGINKKMNYFLSFNAQRVTGATKIYDPDDNYEKSPVYQFLYLGYASAYGTPNHFPAPNIVSASGTSVNGRWSSAPTLVPETPYIFTPVPSWITAQSLAQGWSVANMIVEHHKEGLFSMPHCFFSTATATRFILGDYDGVVKVLATASTKSEDVVEIDGEDYIVVQNGTKTSLVDFTAIRKS